MAATNGLNWTRILSKCSPTVRKTILETRAHHEDLRRLIVEAQQAEPKLDFQAYRRVLPKSMEKMVSEAESQFKAFKTAKSDVTKSLQELDSERDTKIKLSQEFLISLESNIGHFKSQLIKLETAKPVDELTVKDVYEVHPEFRDKIHQMIQEDNWGTAEESSATKKASTERKDSLTASSNEKKGDGISLNYL